MSNNVLCRRDRRRPRTLGSAWRRRHLLVQAGHGRLAATADSGRCVSVGIGVGLGADERPSRICLGASLRCCSVCSARSRVRWAGVGGGEQYRSCTSARCRLPLRQTEGAEPQRQVHRRGSASSCRISRLPRRGRVPARKTCAGLRTSIELSLSGDAGLLQRVTVTTDRQGSATYSFARLPAGLYRDAFAQYPGDEHRDAASEALDLHLDRFP